MKTNKALHLDFDMNGEWGVKDLIEALQDHLDNMPEESREDATLVVESEYDSSHVDGTITYWRPMTEDELSEAGQKKLEREIQVKKRKFEQLKALQKELGIEDLTTSI